MHRQCCTSALCDLLRSASSHEQHDSGSRDHTDAEFWQAVIIGGGYIGMELSASLANNGVKATVVFPEPFLLAR